MEVKIKIDSDDSQEILARQLRDKQAYSGLKEML
jgi:hypothetical protein